MDWRNIIYLTSSSSLTISGTNTIQLKVDDVTSGTITIPNATYDSNSMFANNLEEFINNDSTLLAAGKSVSVFGMDKMIIKLFQKFNFICLSGSNVSKFSLDTHLKFTTTNGGATSNSSQYTVKYTDAAWLGGTATVVNDTSAPLTVPGSGNTFQVTCRRNCIW